MVSLRPKDLYFALSRLSLDHLPRLARRSKRRRSRRPAEPLWLEPLEDRTLLSVSISGTIFNDPGATVFLDAKGTGQIAQQSTFAYQQSNASLTNIDPSAPGDGDPQFATSTPINVSGLSSTFSGLSVTVDVTKDQPGSVAVALASPAGYVYSLGPILFVLEGGFIGGVHKATGFSGTSTPAANSTPSDSAGNYTEGTYTGTSDDTFTLTVLSGGTVGTDNILIGYTDSSGAITGTISLGSGDVNVFKSVAEGIRVQFSVGTLVTGDTFTISGYVPSIDGTFEDNAPAGLASINPISSPTAIVTPIPFGSTTPVTLELTAPNGGPFATPLNDIYNGTGNPNGSWQLIFLDNNLFDPADNSSNIDGLTLNSWSISFTGSDLSTTADQNGNYSFSNLLPGTYAVTVQNSPKGQNPLVDVTVPQSGTAQTNQDITVPLNPDLVGTSFQVDSNANTDWGTQVSVNYTITNQGAGDSAPSDFDIRLTPTGQLDPTDPASAGDLLLTSSPIAIPAIPSGQTFSGQFVVQLPGVPGEPPVGYSALDTAFLNMQINPTGELTETNTVNDFDQGQGLDLAPVVSPANQILSTGPGTQQDPSVAVDPNNPSHVVVAYMDYGLLNDGYAAIEVADSTRSGEPGTWTYSSIPLPTVLMAPGGSMAEGYPVAQFNNQDELFVSFMAAEFLGTAAAGTLPPEIFPEDVQLTANRQKAMLSNNGIFVAGATEGRPTACSGPRPVAVMPPIISTDGQKVPFDAMPDMVADAYGDLFIVWTRYYPAGLMPDPPEPNPLGGTDIYMSASFDGGMTWFPSTSDGTPAGISLLRQPFTAGDLGGSVESTGDQQFASVTFDNNSGVVSIAYYSFSGGAFEVTTTADGEKFSAPSAAFPTPSEGGGLAIPNFNDTNPDAPFYNPAFREVPVRDIVADPTQPGTFFAVEAVAQDAYSSGAGGFDGPTQDAANIVFARSTDGGQTWESVFTVGNSYGNLDSFTDTDINGLGETAINGYTSSLNDDDGGNFLGLSGSSGQAVALQAAPRIFVDNNGDILVVWYDTRRDPSNGSIDVYATLSTDGGQTFSPNFRLTDVSFNPLTGGFYDPSDGQNDNFFLGDFLGLAAASGVAYVAWTDTNTATGAQGIFFTRFTYLAPQPQVADRFDPDQTPATAANLGQVSFQQTFPMLAVDAGSQDYYQLTPLADGKLIITVSASQALTLQILGVGGTIQGAPLFDTQGNLIGAEVTAQVTAGVPVLFEVVGQPVTGMQVPYSLSVEALTADLGTAVTGTQPGALSTGGQDIYALTAPVAGTVVINVSTGSAFTGGIAITVLNGTTVLGTAPPATGAGQTTSVTVPVTAGQKILILVAASPASSSGSFTLDFENLDQFESQDTTSLYYPIPGSVPVALEVGSMVAGSSNLDIVTANTDLTNPISVLVNSGAGLFNAPQTFNGGTGSSNLIGGNARGLVLGTFDNKNDNLDVAMTNFASTDVSVLLNNGNGTLGPDHRSDANVPVGDPSQYPGSVLTADFNGDGNQDLVVFPETTTTGQAPKIAILLGRGDGTFAPPIFLQTDLAQGSVYGAIGDFLGNGLIDIAVFSAQGNTYDVFLNNGDGTFTKLAKATIPTEARSVVAADFNNDGKCDLAVGSEGSGSVYILLSNGDGTFTLAQTVNANTNPARESSSVIGLAIGYLGGVNSSGNSQLGATNGHLDLVAITQAVIGSSPPQLNLICQNHPPGNSAPGTLADLPTRHK